MRTFTVACLTMGLFLQVGCASFPKMTAHRKPKPDPKASTEYLTAKRLESQGKNEPARELYEEMLAKDPKNAEYLHRMAVVCVRLQRYAEADSFFAKAHKRDPKDAGVLADMGYSRYLRHDFPEAERLLRQAVYMKPSDKRAVNNLALVVGRQGKIEESLSLLQKVGDEAAALSSLAYIHIQRGELDLAEQRYHEALEKDPNQKDATNGLAELSKRRTRDTIVADSTPTQTETFRFADLPTTEFDSPAQLPRIDAQARRVADVPTSEFDSPPIKQVAAVEEKETSVTTANFTTASPRLREPALLEEEHEVAAQPAVGKKATATFEDKDQFADEVSSAIPATKIVDEEPQDDDWASGGPVTKKTANKPSIDSAFGFDSTLDDEDSSTNQAAPQQSSSKDRLTFVPSKSRSARLAAQQADKQYSQPALMSDQTE